MARLIDAEIMLNEIKEEVGKIVEKENPEFRLLKHTMGALYDYINSQPSYDPWIPEKEKPEEGVTVIVRLYDGDIDSAIWNGRHWDDSHDTELFFAFGIIKEWMYVPESQGGVKHD